MFIFKTETKLLLLDLKGLSLYPIIQTVFQIVTSYFRSNLDLLPNQNVLSCVSDLISEAHPRGKMKEIR